MDLSATMLVRAGASGLFAVVGIAILALARGRRTNAGLGLWAVGDGLSGVVSNLFFLDAATAPMGLALAAVARGASASGLGLWLLASQPARRIASAVPIGLALAAAFIMPIQSLLPPTPSGSAELRAMTGLVSAVDWVIESTAVVALAMAARATGDALDRRAYALLAIVIAASNAYMFGAAFTGPIPFERPGLVFLAIVPSVWLWASFRVGRPAIAVAWVVLAIALLGVVDTPLFGGSTIFGTSLMTALLVTVEAALVVYGIVRMRLLGFDLAAPTARRGTLATVALVGFFVVAQITQEFLSETKGVLLGGAAAGALLFAAVPLQRAAERLANGERRAPLGPGVSPLGGAAGEAYREALRLAIHDGAMTPEEERHLARLADRIGISYGEALRLRDEVEAEGATRG